MPGRPSAQQDLPISDRRTEVHCRHWCAHLALPLAGFSLTVLTIAWFQFDLLLADFFYSLQGGRWALKNHSITSTLLHRGGRNLLVAMAVVVFLAAVMAPYVTSLKPYRRGLWYLFLVMAIAPLTVNLLKLTTHIDCPWDLARYGGTSPYVSLFSRHPGDFPYGSCFPSAHASGGYSLVALYFLARTYRPAWRWAALATGLLFGIVYGFAQQLRGAHFLSHDVWALAICWLIALVLSYVMLDRPDRTFATRQED